MITTKDQEELLKLIADYLTSTIECLAIGGTAMMFSGYKNATKDIDLVFKNKRDRDTFIRAIGELGYKEKALADIYDKKRKENTSKPLLFSRGEERFDLFTETVFGFNVDFSPESIYQRHDFLGKKELTILVPDKVSLILFKSITGRDTDYEDIETIVKIEKVIDWEKIIHEAIKQKKNLPWILVDLEQTLQRLREVTLIKQRYFELIYKAQKK
ncbi:hypothetical protein COY95_00525 [Candidatus Woesearchaeota archaeon CG_4_10_14_0_8_um_filter_47_5]|nr:MAG: hypothetical protein COY95_00525 [Candidatus Woesearchaeota archaeon CG_4_10_14_0_8_um_filter_47_5]